MAETKTSLSFLSRPEWWASTSKLIRPCCRRFLLPALLLAISNCCGIYSEQFLSGGGLDLGSMASGAQLDLSKAISVCCILTVTGLVATVTGLASCSIWLIELTALVRLFLDEGDKDFKQALKEVKAQSKYLTTVWLIALIYLLAPIVVLSGLLSMTILSSSHFTMFGDPILVLPPAFIMPMNVTTALMAVIVMIYTIVLMVLSAPTTIKPKSVASLSSDLMLKKCPDIAILSFLLLLINVVITAPFALFFAVPALAPLLKNQILLMASQFWLAFTSIYVWPLSVLIFAEFLRPILANQEQAVTKGETLKG